MTRVGSLSSRGRRVLPDVVPETMPAREEWRVPANRPRRPAHPEPSLSEPARTALFLALHVPLALIATSRPGLATFYAMGTFALGAWWATSSPRLERVAWITAYIAGAEVFWRMSEARIYWEFGKYATAAIFLLALLRNRKLTPPMLPLLYFALLLPSVVLTVMAGTLSAAREEISFNLSGPLALMVAAWFFSRARLSPKALRTMFFAFMAPAICVATRATSSTFFESVTFFNASNVATSGGYGPNQVSAVLGLGALLAFFVMLDPDVGRGMRALMIAVLGWLAVQSALTFSRSGLYMAAASAAIAIWFLVQDRRFRAKLLPIAVLVFTVGNYVVVPYLNAFTDGALGERFQDLYLTGRDRMIRADLELWRRNPIFGVGPGEGSTFRGEVMAEGRSGAVRTGPRKLAAHTEFTRLLSEHGVFGLVGLCVLLFAAFSNVRRMTDQRTKAVVAALISWSALFMLGDGMRIVAPSLAFGIGFAVLLSGAPSGAPVPVGNRSRLGRRRPLVTATRIQPSGV